MTDVDPREQADTLRAKLKSRDTYVQYDADYRHLLQMSDNIRLVPSKIGEHRHVKLLRHCRRMAALAPPPDAEDFVENDEADDAGIATEDDVDALLEEEGLLGATLEFRAATEAIVRWINTEYSNEHTNQDFRTALRSFGTYRLKLDEPPETLDWVPTGTSNNFDPVPSERDLLRWEEEVKPMIDATLNSRDAALIALQFEGGLRSGELFDLRVGDIFDGNHALGVHVDGKQGERSVHLIVATPYIQRWLSDHPASDDDTAPLWSKLSTPERASYNTWLDYFKNAADRVGVQKEVTPTNFRKSNTRWLVKRGLSQPEIEDRQGRKRGSDHTARYMAHFGDESLEKRYARAHGEEVESEEPEDLSPITCPRCDEETPRNLDFCMHCSQTLDIETKQLLDQVTRTMEDKALDHSDPELLDGARSLREKPNMMDKDELHQLATSLSDSESE